MTKRSGLLMLTLGLLAATLPVAAQTPAPLTLVGHYDLTGAPAGHMDHVAIDLAGRRLFATAEGGAVTVTDLRTGKLAHTITNAQEPHGLLYRSDLDRLYVTDGGAGLLRIYDGKSYREVGTVKLWDDADSVGYDPATHDLYVDSGGGDLHESFSHFSQVDTTAAKLVRDSHIDGDTIEAMQIATQAPLIYLNIRSKHQIAVINRQTHQVQAVWTIQGAADNTAMALDEAHHRLYVGCRSGRMVIFDTTTGKQLAALPVGKMVDDMVYDPASQRIYAACDGAVYVYHRTGPDKYESSQVKSAALGKTALLVPSLHRYYVAVPKAGSTPARILVFRVN